MLGSVYGAYDLVFVRDPPTLQHSSWLSCVFRENPRRRSENRIPIYMFSVKNVAICSVHCALQGRRTHGETISVMSTLLRITFEIRSSFTVISAICPIVQYAPPAARSILKKHGGDDSSVENLSYTFYFWNSPWQWKYTRKIETVSIWHHIFNQKASRAWCGVKVQNKHIIKAG